MQKTLIKISMLASFLSGVSLAHAGDIGVNVVVEGEVAPGVYGRVELGKDSHPDLVYREPRVIVVEEKYRRYKPIYLHVPPGHAKHWDKHCHEYNACNRKVYFIKSAEYSPDYHREEHNHHDHDSDHGKHKGNKGQEKGNGKNKNH